MVDAIRCSLRRTLLWLCTLTCCVHIFYTGILFGGALNTVTLETKTKESKQQKHVLNSLSL